MIPVVLSIAIIVSAVVSIVYSLKRLLSLRSCTLVCMFAGSVLGTLFLGIEYGNFATFQVSDVMRVQGLPIPLVVYVLEEGRWTDFVMPGVIGYVFMAGNALFPVFVVGVVWLIVGSYFASKWRSEATSGSEPKVQ